MRAAIPWAPASIQMMDELFNRAIVQRGDRSIFAPKPMNQVFGPLECASEPLSLHSPPGTTLEQTLQARGHLGRRVVPGYVKLIRKTLPT